MKNYLENVDREALRARAEQMLHYADEARDTASRWTNHAVEKAHGFSLFDFAIFETCLLSLGLWLGACFSKCFKNTGSMLALFTRTCFSKCFKKLRTLFFVAFAASWLYMLWRVFFDDED